jgi:hypothetical protein
VDGPSAGSGRLYAHGGSNGVYGRMQGVEGMEVKELHSCTVSQVALRGDRAAVCTHAVLGWLMHSEWW